MFLNTQHLRGARGSDVAPVGENHLNAPGYVGQAARPPGSGAGTNAREPGPAIIFNRKKHLHFSSVRYGPTHRDTTPRH